MTTQIEFLDKLLMIATLDEIRTEISNRSLRLKVRRAEKALLLDGEYKDKSSCCSIETGESLTDQAAGWSDLDLCKQRDFSNYPVWVTTSGAFPVGFTTAEDAVKYLEGGTSITETEFLKDIMHRLQCMLKDCKCNTHIKRLQAYIENRIEDRQ